MAPPAGPDPEPGERHRRLAEQGWVRRFVGGPSRLEEVVELYEATGHEVRLERPGRDELADACGGCAAALELFRVIYTRRRGDESGGLPGS